MDLLFSRLQLATISENLDVTDYRILRNVDERSLRSINGVRIVPQILRLVPNPETFRVALRCFKLWAKRVLRLRLVCCVGGVRWR
jgi:poly(A) polymerase